MSELFDMVWEEGKSFIDKADKVADGDEMRRILKYGPETLDDLKHVPESPLDSVMGPIGTGLDLLNIGKAGYNFADAALDDDGHGDVEVVDGIHDLLDGGSGLLGTYGGALAPYAKAFNAGFTVGDMIAPLVYTDRPEMQTVPEDGTFEAETGNESIDEIIEGGSDIADGEYLDGALDIADGVSGVLAPIVPGGGALEFAKDMWELGDGDDKE